MIEDLKHGVTLAVVLGRGTPSFLSSFPFSQADFSVSEEQEEETVHVETTSFSTELVILQFGHWSSDI